MYKFSELIPYNRVGTLTKTQITSWLEGEKLINPGIKWDIRPSDLVGIEIEIENLGRAAGFLCWSGLADHSLRNHGMEYRTAAFPAQYTPEIVNEFFTGMRVQNPKYHFSDRTSIHVHIDFRNEYLEDLIKIFLAFIPFEKVIFQELMPTRAHNTFCLPVSDILTGNDGFNQAIFNMKNNKFVPLEYIETITGAFIGKYSAINPLNLWQRRVERAEHTGTGTLEFRMLHGTDDINLITTWVKLICLLKSYATKVSFLELESDLFTLNSSSEYQKFAEKVFGKYANVVIPVNNFRKLIPLLSEGVSSAKELIIPKAYQVDSLEFLQSPLARTLQQRIEKQHQQQTIIKKDVGQLRAQWQQMAQREVAPRAVIGDRFFIEPAPLLAGGEERNV